MSYQFDFAPVFAGWQPLLEGCIVTLRLSAISCVLGLLAGIVVMLMQRSPVKAVSRVASGFIEAVRNTPFLVQIFFLFFGLPAMGIHMPVEPAAILALAMNAAAFIAEILRGGVESIPRGQIDAAKALGMKSYQVYRHVVLRTALRAVYPSLTSQFVLLLLGSSVTASISADELMSAAQILESGSFRSFEVYLVVAVFYLAMSQAFTFVFWLIKRRYFSYPLK